MRKYLKRLGTSALAAALILSMLPLRCPASGIPVEHSNTVSGWSIENENKTSGWSTEPAYTPVPGPVVFTEAGPVRGMETKKNGKVLHSFKGLPYATVTARFAPPSATGEWTQVRSAADYGPISFQSYLYAAEKIPVYPNAGDDCLNLNLWTPGLDSGKRPVAVWFHGAGLSGGSGNDALFDGSALALGQDVVVVSVNHRLNAMGFLDLSAYPGFEGSANLGIQDMIAALKWIQANIEKFGGDPNKVTIFGESGGGLKVLSLMSAPAAAGLFQQAVMQSAITESYDLTFLSKDFAQDVADTLLKDLGLTPDTAGSLRSMPAVSLQTAANKAFRAVSSRRGAGKSPASTAGWTTVLDGDVITANPAVDGFPEFVNGVPLLIGTNLMEWNTKYTQTGLTPEQYAVAFRAFFRAYPTRIDLTLSEIDTTFRAVCLGIAEQKAKQDAPVYNYIYAYKNATHTAELPLLFGNLPAGASEADRSMSAVLQSVWAAFFRSGDPSVAAAPGWAAFKAEDRACMLLDSVCSLQRNHDKALIELLRPGA